MSEGEGGRGIYLGPNEYTTILYCDYQWAQIDIPPSSERDARRGGRTHRVLREDREMGWGAGGAGGREIRLGPNEYNTISYNDPRIGTGGVRG